jgi:hypothetical protein
MNEKNYEYLTDQLKRTGFGDTLNDECAGISSNRIRSLHLTCKRIMAQTM